VTSKKKCDWEAAVDFYLTLWAIDREREVDVVALRLSAAASAREASRGSKRTTTHRAVPRALWSFLAAVSRPLLRRHT